MQTRRLVAAGAVVVIVVVMALLIHSCDASATNSALKNYNASVFQLITGSTGNAQTVLRKLTQGNLTSISTDLASAEQKAQQNLSHAQSLNAPSQMAAAQSSLVDVMHLRQHALLLIANNAQQAASKSTSKDAVYQISLGTSELYSSDVIYKSFVAPDIAKALNAAGIAIGGGSGEQPINGDQVIPDLGWLNQTWIADKINAQLSTAQANANNDQPGLTHGDQLDGSTVAGVLLTNGGSYTLTASQSKVWVLSVTDGGQTSENDVGCSVKIQNVSDSGTATIPTVAAGATTSCTVTLPSTPPTGPYSVTANVAKVPGEKNVTNNTQTYTVTFK